MELLNKIEIEEVSESRKDAAWDAVWPIFHAVISGSDAFPHFPTTTFEEAKTLWFCASSRHFTASVEGRVVGAYRILPNKIGLGSHVANGGYIVDPECRGRGIASAMLEHSIETARAAGFRAMQFNNVVSTNERAVQLWKRYGFKEVGRVPQAFAHGRGDYVDVLIMHRFL
ncbi:MAG TPA: GNAT family N-acetyltransferase [Candidatus Baltobacteraceae bacterium]|nr:GNAT family N-acetyltransferase [Candidatus Baltobacteraceae bacterium]